MKVQVSTPGLYSLRRDLMAIKAGGLGKPMAKRFTKVVKPLNAAIKTEAATLPSRGGYAAVMARSVRSRVQVRENRLSALIAVRLYAVGKKERRDIIRVNQGRIRHPVHGRSRRLKSGQRQANPWATTNARPGFVSRPIQKVGPQVTQAGRQVVNDLMKELKG